MKSSKSLLLATFLGATFSSFTIILLHFLRTDYNPISRYVSEYAIGQYGRLAVISFIVFGLSIVSFYIQTRKKLSKAYLSILIWGLSIIILGFFNTDLKKAEFSPHGIIHALATGIGFGSFAIGSLFLSNQFKKYPSVFKILSWITVVFLFPLALGLLGDKLYAYNLNVPFPLNLLSEISGLTERVVLVSSTLWLFLAIYSTLKNKN